MHRHIKTAGVALGLAVMAGCDSWLTGPGLTENPNFPVVVSTEQLLVATQARLFLWQEGQAARTSAIWTQQVAGINNQQRDYGSRYDYATRELDTNTAFNNIYQAGGLIDIRRLQELAEAEGDNRVLGIAMVLEALTMGTATSLWGDIPYREAVDPEIAVPGIDPQEQIYADVQALLSDAITVLSGAPTTALESDLVYRGNSTRWIAAAHTLKARYYLHVAPRVGTQAYQNALTHANQGINEPPTSVDEAIHGQAPGDFRSWHGTTLNVNANIWANFLAERADIAANKRMIDILRDRNDPRLAQYHYEIAGGGYGGSNQFGTGGDPLWSLLNSDTRIPLDFRQPFITWAENQLIKAEAHFQLGGTGLVEALNLVNTVRAAVGMSALPGPITLEEIMVEKWIVQFQNVDAFSDWRRTCYPRLIPGGPGDPTPAARVPGRYVYGSTERNQNPNFEGMAPSQQPADNWNFAAQGACPVGNTGGERYPVP
jgi:starch-binding outer membrane protein, SusD/RagB family